ncbi:hypothetical protein PISMIDRAFT_18671 [Pisolithus microcarpus 441]|uniref:DUF6593 domain-containing protein n=1 Tax=Pisolithus microcarpus 441 TaxID=765257 RepID=A0A0C9YXA9_9AGAM|nr:hypothetical protein PISMIDRAFT_18671 [Pisolithus microcarpus 441]
MDHTCGAATDTISKGPVPLPNGSSHYAQEARLEPPFVMSALRVLLSVQFQLPSSGDRSFTGPDGKTYHWKSNAGLLRNEMQCSDMNGVVVATYRITMMAVSKDGELRINPLGQFMVDFLVATALAMRTPNY